MGAIHELDRQSSLRTDVTHEVLREHVLLGRCQVSIQRHDTAIVCSWVHRLTDYLSAGWQRVHGMDPFSLTLFDHHKHASMHTL